MRTNSAIRFQLGNRTFHAYRALSLDRAEQPVPVNFLPPTLAWNLLERSLLSPRDCHGLSSLFLAVTGTHVPAANNPIATPRTRSNARGNSHLLPLRDAFLSGRWLLQPPAANVGGGSKAEPPTPQKESIAEQIKSSRLVKTWIEMEVVDDSGKPMAGYEYLCMMPDGKLESGTLDAQGRIRFSGIDPGNCVFSLTKLDQESWHAAS